MKNIKNIPNLFRVLAVVIVFTAASCTPQDELVKPTEVAPAATPQVTTPDDASTASLTVTGTFTEFSDQADCSACAYVVPEDATVVDGSDFKPGDVICLNKSFKYQALEFVNMEGTNDSPIIIANCGE